jgi:hypothetical protein
MTEQRQNQSEYQKLRELMNKWSADGMNLDEAIQDAYVKWLIYGTEINLDERK